MEGYRNRHYGLTGRTVRVRRQRGSAVEEARLEGTLGLDPYPWEGREVPVRITAEYPAFLVGTVLDHIGPKGWPITGTYPITITKHDIFTGKMIINGGRIR